MSERTSDLVYDQLADTYEEDPEHHVPTRIKRELLASLMTPDARVLDVGCATARQLELLGPSTSARVGLDLNAKMLRRAADETSAQLVQGSAMDLPFPTATFDLVWSFSTLLLVPDLESCVAEIARVLRVGGRAVFDVAGRRNIGTMYWRRWYRSQGHDVMNAVSLPDARSLLDRHGLDVTRTVADGAGDQVRFLPGLHRWSSLERFWNEGVEWNRDFALSNAPGLERLAGRWFFVATRR